MDKMEKLIKFLEERLKSKYDAVQWAKGTLEAATDDLQELKRWETKTGHTETYRLSDFGLFI